MTTNPPAGSGILGMIGDGRCRIRFDRTLRHPLPAVWAALTDPAKFATWMQGCRIDPRVGGEVFFDFGEEGSATGVITAIRSAGEADPVAELVHTWDWDSIPTSQVTWRLEPHEVGTRLILTHVDLPTEPATDFAVGWHIILDVLDRYFAGRSWADVWDQYPALAEHYQALLATGAEPR
ncbi:SRPBCC family protein [Microlunatus parietis]|uniref:Uncharacterized protein YndB with AHSA1/START domain n=1 Tax=Microlunatus parietis TaxID=682979 RepID=A0A7Y9IA63_9ACTN|nr:SRPBCC family protein [Microlunatus parietis]NYE72925.1 uncharacterized protein YndB with AHSA1/START domain [Microlunatus parietis]